MFFTRHKTTLLEPEQVLPGRDTPLPVPDRHDVLGTPIQPPFPDGIETAVFGMGCFWGAERVFWQAPGVYTTAVGYAGGQTPNPTYEEVCSARTNHTEVVLVAYDPAQTSYEAMLKLFWENHDPTQGMRQGNDVGTQYRSAIYATTPEQLEGRRGVARDVPGAARRVGLRRDQHRDRRGRAVLLRRGLPPAVPGQEPERLLRARRHRRLVPDRHGRHERRLSGGTSSPAAEDSTSWARRRSRVASRLALVTQCTAARRYHAGRAAKSALASACAASTAA